MGLYLPGREKKFLEVIRRENEMLIFDLKNMTDEEKGILMEMLEKMLVVQAMEQHMERLEEWKHGKVVNYWFEDKDDAGILFIQYESGSCFSYSGIDLGAEGMRICAYE